MSLGKLPARRAAVAVATILAALVATGCREYKVEMRIRANGSGERVTTIEAEPDPPAETRALLGLASGWSEAAIVRDGKPAVRFARQVAIGREDDWGRLPPDLLVLSDAAGRASLGSHVSVQCGRSDAGRRCTYQETIGWRDLRETMADVYADSLDRALRDSVPDLDHEVRAEVRGLVHGAVLLRWDSLMEAEGHEHEAEGVIDALAREAGRAAGRGHAPGQARRVTQLVRSVCLAPQGRGLNPDPALGALPGIELPFDSSLEMHVTLPGTIVQSNADQIQDRTAVWRIDLSKALQGDIVLHAEADLGG